MPPSHPSADVVSQSRRAVVRAHLLASGAWDIPSIAAAREISVQDAHAWVAAEWDADRLLVVAVDDDTLRVPGLLLDDDGEICDDVAPIGPLRDAGLDDWGVWLHLSGLGG
jgi:hypothetical protein